MATRFTIQLTFKADISHGLMVLLHRTDKVADWALLYLIEGTVTFSFNPGGGIQNLTSPVEVMDDNWHLLSFTYDRLVGGTLTVDNNSTSVQPVGSYVAINMQGPFYIGGTADGIRVDLLHAMVG